MKPSRSNHDTKWRKAIPIEINMWCEVYKFAQSANILTCSELFTIGWSIVALMFQELVMVINSKCS
jgi:hypothetical protein